MVLVWKGHKNQILNNHKQMISINPMQFTKNLPKASWDWTQTPIPRDMQGAILLFKYALKQNILA